MVIFQRDNLGKTYMDNPAHLVAYIAASLDGYIAPANGSVDWLEPFAAVDYGFDAFFADIETLVMGRSTYDQCRGFDVWPYPGRRTTVLTHRDADPDAPDGVSFHACEPAALMDALGSVISGKSWIVGGGSVLGQFLAANLVSRLDLFVVPVLLGGGIPLFPEGTVSGAPQLLTSKTFENGVVWLAYALDGAEAR
jgi:dihydrofolate reductase